MASMSVTLSRFTAADQRTPTLRTTAVKPSSRLPRGRRLRLMCSKDREEFMDEVMARMDELYYRPYGRTVDPDKLNRVLGLLPDRDLFVPEGIPAYVDLRARMIKNGQYITTIAQPSQQVFTLLELEPYLPYNGKALDVGSGTGFTTAYLSNLLGREGRVIGVEINLSAFNYGKSCLEKWNKFALEDGSVMLKHADVFGDEPFAYDDLKRIGPYDVIHVGAAISTFEEELKLLDLLKPGGAMVLAQYPLEFPGPPDESQALYKYTKSEEGEITAEEIGKVIYVLMYRGSSTDG